MKIGSRIKALRTRQRTTLKDLSKKTGLTTSFLSQLERDVTSPSVPSLEKIAKALNTKIGYFFEREEGKELIVLKRGMGKRVLDKKRKVLCEGLASGFLNIKIEPQFFTLATGAKLTKGSLSTGGETFGIVLKGKVKLLCNSEKLILEEGDSVYLAYTRKPDKLVNIGKTSAKLLWIVITPI